MYSPIDAIKDRHRGAIEAAVVESDRAMAKMLQAETDEDRALARREFFVAEDRVMAAFDRQHEDMLAYRDSLLGRIGGFMSWLVGKP